MRTSAGVVVVLAGLAAPAMAAEPSVDAHVRQAGAPEIVLLQQIVTACRDAIYGFSTPAGMACLDRTRGWEQRFGGDDSMRRYIKDVTRLEQTARAEHQIGRGQAVDAEALLTRTAGR